GFLFSHNFVLSTNIHTGYEVVNYPWDTWQHHHAENDWYEYISREYADTVHAYKPPSLGNYLSAQNNGITNGFAWYTIDGGRQDYMNFYLNSRETTMELSYTKTPNASMLPLYWEANYRSVLNYMEHCLYGFTGKITEAGSGGVPVIAKVEVINHDFDNSHIYSHHANGQYFRLLLPGVYSLRFSAPGYKDVTLEDLTLMPGENPVYDVEMEINPESINEFGELKNDISVYPNPTNGLLHCAFNMKQPGKVSFVFYDHQGKVVQSNLGEFFIQGKQFREFNISSFKKGNYILLFIFDDFRYSIKINKE
ncbi:MAG: M14 family zinc carboxypeptidase, partial [Bacteroidota bacterium]|nr:M14 family zinc carboxypeptidase [Bacteroidota bacterium]